LCCFVKFGNNQIKPSRLKRAIDIDKLVRGLKRGDVDPFNELFDHYSSKLYHFAFGYLKSKEEAEELVQDVFTKVWEKRSQLNEEYQFQSYLFTIAFNQIKKHFRSKNLLETYLEHASQSLAYETTTQSEVGYRELKDIVNQLINRMPDKRRLVFLKSRMEGKNAQEIAVEMEISKKTAENHLHAALKFLKAELAKEHLLGLLFFYIHFF